jgi:hypothetical protein
MRVGTSKIISLVELACRKTPLTFSHIPKWLVSGIVDEIRECKSATNFFKEHGQKVSKPETSSSQLNHEKRQNSFGPGGGCC